MKGPRIMTLGDESWVFFRWESADLNCRFDPDEDGVELEVVVFDEQEVPRG